MDNFFKKRYIYLCALLHEWLIKLKIVISCLFEFVIPIIKVLYFEENYSGTIWFLFIIASVPHNVWCNDIKVTLFNIAEHFHRYYILHVI